MASVSHFELTVSGRAEIPHAAERALLNVSVASQGKNKAAVSDEVVTTSKHIESMLRELSSKDNSPEAKAAAALAHWNKTSLSATSYIPYSQTEGQSHPIQYKASVKFDIRFKEFKALGTFGTKISSLPHVEVTNIDWILTDTTEKSYRSRLRREAAADALEKARDYCDVLGCDNMRPVQLTEAAGSYYPARGMNISYAPMQSEYPHRPMQAQQAMVPSRAPADYRKEDLEFRPQEVRMSMEVTIKFHANPVKNG